jgi:uncharacterized protein YkwD
MGGFETIGKVTVAMLVVAGAVGAGTLLLGGSGPSPADEQTTQPTARSSATPTDGARAATSSATPTATPQAAGATQRGVNRSAVQRIFVFYLNKYRENNYKMASVSADERLAAIAVNHSRDMAQRGYFAHESPDGETVSDRYEAAGVLGTCGFGPSEQQTAGENIAKTKYRATVTPGYADGAVRVDSEQSLARHLLDTWQASAEHDELLLAQNVDRLGLGIFVTPDDTVYATLNVC